MPGAAGMVDPVQWWTSLTNQFQEIATNAMRDVSQHAANAPAMAGVGGGAAQDALQKASDMATQFAAESVKGAQAMTRSAMAAATKATGATAKKPAAKATTAAKKTAPSAAAKKAKPKAPK